MYCLRLATNSSNISRCLRSAYSQSPSVFFFHQRVRAHTRQPESVRVAIYSEGQTRRTLSGFRFSACLLNFTYCSLSSTIQLLDRCYCVDPISHCIMSSQLTSIIARVNLHVKFIEPPPAHFLQIRVRLPPGLPIATDQSNAIVRLMA